MFRYVINFKPGLYAQICSGFYEIDELSSIFLDADHRCVIYDCKWRMSHRIDNKKLIEHINTVHSRLFMIADHEEHEVRLPASQVRLPMNQDRLPTNQARLPVNQVQLPVNQDRLPANQPSESKHNFTKESFLSLLDLNKNASPKSTDGQPIKPYKPKLMACCVCGIAKEWTGNYLIACNGKNGYYCPVIVHKTCYGVLKRTDDWLCSKCSLVGSQTDVSCELCPNKDGAFKRTGNGAFVHAICALYNPAIKFGNLQTMEPVRLGTSLSGNRHICSICLDNGNRFDANIGSSIKCNEAGCEKYFHVTCAQASGLLVEETYGKKSYLKCYGYCNQHKTNAISKNIKVKPLPPFTPLKRKHYESIGLNDPGINGKKRAFCEVRLSSILNEHSYFKVSNIITECRRSTEDELNRKIASFDGHSNVYLDYVVIEQANELQVDSRSYKFKANEADQRDAKLVELNESNKRRVVSETKRCVEATGSRDLEQKNTLKANSCLQQNVVPKVANSTVNELRTINNISSSNESIGERSTNKATQSVNTIEKIVVSTSCHLDTSHKEYEKYGNVKKNGNRFETYDKLIDEALSNYKLNAKRSSESNSNLLSLTAPDYRKLIKTKHEDDELE